MWIYLRVSADAIIDLETFNIVQQHIKARTRRRTRKYNWLLNCLTECAECGKN